MSAQLGEQIGLGVAPDKIIAKARGMFGTAICNSSSHTLPQIYSLHMGTSNSPADCFGLEDKFPVNGRVKQVGIFVVSQSWTLDAQVIIQKNRVPIGDPILLPASTPANTLIKTPLDLDLEFLQDERISFRVEFVSGGSGNCVLSTQAMIEFDFEDIEGDFKDNVFMFVTRNQNLTGFRRYMPNTGNPTNGVSSQSDIHPFEAGRILALGCNVATGFSTTTTHSGAIQKFGVNQIIINYIVGETGVKFDVPLPVAFLAEEGICLLFGNSSVPLEPMSTFGVYEVDEP